MQIRTSKLNKSSRQVIYSFLPTWINFKVVAKLSKYERKFIALVVRGGCYQDKVSELIVRIPSVMPILFDLTYLLSFGTHLRVLSIVNGLGGIPPLKL